MSWNFSFGTPELLGVMIVFNTGNEGMIYHEEYLDSKRQEGDTEADQLIGNVFTSGKAAQFYAYLSSSMEEARANNEVPEVREFLFQPAVIPAWFDASRLSRGQAFFHKYALDIMTLLGAMSLPYCYAASPGNKAIYLTEKMRKKPGKRLLDTAQFIIEVMKPDAFSSAGGGTFEIQKTRLIHALVRHYIGDKTAWNPDWGVPVNQEDMAGTNLAFSYIILVGMEESDFPLSDIDKEDFLYAWRFIGYQLRIDEGLLPRNVSEARLLEEAIRRRHFRESPEGPLLVSDLIHHYRESFPAVAAYFVDSQIRYFIGPDVAALLGLRPDPTKDKIVGWMNRLRKKINRSFVNPFSYQIMMRNHLKLKKKYAAS